MLHLCADETRTRININKHETSF